jgi:hypothetical protein
MENRVVAHFRDKRKVKGFTNDFFPNKQSFHLTTADRGEVLEIQVADLKGLFFVRSFEGDRTYLPDQDLERQGLGRKIRVRFQDGEEMVGYTSGYSPGREAFWVFPPDPGGNNLKVFVVAAATDEVAFL